MVELREKRLWKSQVHHWPLYNDGTEKMRKSGLTLSRRGELSVWELIISCHCETDKNINSRMDDTLWTPAEVCIFWGSVGHYCHYCWQIREERRGEGAARPHHAETAAQRRHWEITRRSEGEKHLWLSRGSVLQISWGLSFIPLSILTMAKRSFHNPLLSRACDGQLMIETQ